MTTNFVDLLSREFSGDITNRIANTLGEDTSKTRTALSGIIPALVGGLASKASTKEGAADLLALLKQNHFDGSQMTDTASALANPSGASRLTEMGSSLLSSILGTRAGAITDWVASLGGLRRSSASSLLGLATPLVLGQLGRLVSGIGWSPSSLMNLLSSQKPYLQGAPPGLANVLGLGGAEYTATARPSATVDHTSRPVEHRSSWWKWALPLLALVGLLGYCMSRTPSNLSSVAVQPSATVRVDVNPAIVSAPVRADLGAFLDKKLPNGISIRIPANGVESKLIGFLEDPTRKVDNETWFSFDRLEFESDVNTLKPSSGEQLRNIAEILKAYPAANVKIGGYTDNVGNTEYNLKLSQDRAFNTMNEISRLGIDQVRLAAQGYGEQHPVADNSTEEGRQRNRRIDIHVTQK
jgi:OmpA-OmpF porin, OOP family